MPTLKKIISYQFSLILLKGINHEQSSQNSESTCCSPLKYGGGFQEKLFMGGQTFLGKNIYGVLILNGKTDNQWSDHAKVGEEFHKW